MSGGRLIACDGGAGCHSRRGAAHLAVRDGVPVGIGRPGDCDALIARAEARRRLAATLGASPAAVPGVTVAVLPGPAQAVAATRAALDGLDPRPEVVVVGHPEPATCETPLLALIEAGARPEGDWLRALAEPFANPAVAATTAPPAAAPGELPPDAAAVLAAHARGGSVDALEGHLADVPALSRAAVRCYRVADVRDHGGIPATAGGEARLMLGLIASGGRIVPVPAAALPGAPATGPLPNGRLRPARRTMRPPGTSQAPPARNGGTEPELSVIIPTTPARHDALVECAAAAATQTLPRDTFEVIAVVNGRGEVPLRPVPGADVVEALPVPSAAAARNHGARIARGRWVVFVDDDVLLEPGALAAHLSALRDGAGVTLGPYHPEDDPSVTGAFARLWWNDHLSRKARPDHVMSFTDLITGNTGIAREAYLAFGGLDETFPGAHREDWELGLRLLRGGIAFTAVPEAAGIHRHRLTPTKYLRDRRAQGYGDVVLVERHPETAGAVTLGRLAGRTSGPRWHAVVAAGRLMAWRPVVATLEAALPRLDTRRALSVLRAAASAAYCAGVQAAISDGHHATGVAGGMELDLVVGPPRSVPVASPVNVFDAGVPLGTVDLPGGQWDTEVVAAAIADMPSCTSRRLAGTIGQGT